MAHGFWPAGQVRTTVVCYGVSQLHFDLAKAGSRCLCNCCYAHLHMCASRGFQKIAKLGSRSREQQPGPLQGPGALCLVSLRARRFTEAGLWAVLLRSGVRPAVATVVPLPGIPACWSEPGTAAKWGAAPVAGSSLHDFIIGRVSQFSHYLAPVRQGLDGSANPSYRVVPL